MQMVLRQRIRTTLMAPHRLLVLALALVAQTAAAETRIGAFGGGSFPTADGCVIAGYGAGPTNFQGYLVFLPDRP